MATRPENGGFRGVLVRGRVGAREPAARIAPEWLAGGPDAGGGSAEGFGVRRARAREGRGPAGHPKGAGLERAGRRSPGPTDHGRATARARAGFVRAVREPGRGADGATLGVPEREGR